MTRSRSDDKYTHGPIKSYDSLKRWNDEEKRARQMLSRRPGSLTAENSVFALRRREQGF